MTDKPDNPESQENVVTFDRRKKRGRRDSDKNQDSVSFKGNSPQAQQARGRMELQEELQGFFGNAPERIVEKVASIPEHILYYVTILTIVLLAFSWLTIAFLAG